MEVIRDELVLQNTLKELKKQGKTIGLVPTMGALHQGHMSLVKESVANNDITVCSIFVNPTQFGPNEDLDAYPRTFEADKAKLVSQGCDYIFFPEATKIYPQGYATYVEVQSDLVNKLCGGRRPGHFRGVTTIVNMLFNVCLPDNAYFGLKDYQQVQVILRMVKDLRIPVNVVPMPIIREEDGLALSSRNRYLTEDERKEALVLSQSLKLAKKAVEEGERSVDSIYSLIESHIKKAKDARIDYIEIIHHENLEKVKTITPSKTVVALAVYLGKARLIDNIIL